MKRDQNGDRKLGKYWENQLGKIIVPFGFSLHKTPPPGVDGIIWNETGRIVYIQVRHKEPFNWGDIGPCYGYERYRLESDMEIVRTGGIALYVIHDHSRLGRYSRINELQDWVAQYISSLSNSIDVERIGPTYYGGSYVRKPICYWTINKFNPLAEILNQASELLEQKG